MCFADTDVNNDGTHTAFCYCGWNEQHATAHAAETAAADHQNAAD
jgi:hypothetical protein